MTQTPVPAHRRWLASYPAGVPSSVAPYSDRTIVDHVLETERTTPARAALRFEGRTMSYRVLMREARLVAAGLRRLNVKAGDRVALLLPNCPQFIVSELACWLIGAVVCPANPTYPEEEMAAVLARTGAQTAIVLTSFYDKLKSVQAQTAIRTVVATSIKDYLPWHKRVLFTILKEKKGGHRITLASGDHWFMKSRRRTPLGALPTVTPDDIALILPSGGTTGTPKGVLGTHRAIVAAGRQLEAWLQSTLKDGTDEIMLPLPLFHVYGCVGVQGLCFVSARTMTLIPNPRDIDAVVRMIETVRPTFFAGVPTLFTALLAHKRVKSGQADFSSIRLSFSGAAALMSTTREQFERLTGGLIIEGYSLTEGQMATIAGPVGAPARPGSIGLPLPDVDVLLVDAELGETEVPHGDVGEIAIRAPQVTPGYLDAPEETAGLLKTHADGTVWLYTGDLARMDDEGYLYIVDRKKDLIKVSGFQVVL